MKKNTKQDMLVAVPFLVSVSIIVILAIKRIRPKFNFSGFNLWMLKDPGSAADWVSALLSMFAILIVFWQVNRQIEADKELELNRVRPIFSLDYLFTNFEPIKADMRIFVSRSELMGDVKDRLRKNEIDSALEINNFSSFPMLAVVIQITYKVKIEKHVRQEKFNIKTIKPRETLRCIPVHALWPNLVDEANKNIDWKSVLDEDERSLSDPQTLPLSDDVDIWFTTQENERFHYIFLRKDSFENLKIVKRNKLKNNDKSYDIQNFRQSDYRLGKDLK